MDHLIFGFQISASVSIIYWIKPLILQQRKQWFPTFLWRAGSSFPGKPVPPPITAFCQWHNNRLAGSPTHVVFAAPNLRYTAVNIQQGIDRLHTCAHGILSSENGIPRVSRQIDRWQVHSALRHYLWAVGFFSRLEKGVDIRHKAGCGIAGIWQKTSIFQSEHQYGTAIHGKPLRRCSCASPFT